MLREGAGSSAMRGAGRATIYPSLTPLSRGEGGELIYFKHIWREVNVHEVGDHWRPKSNPNFPQVTHNESVHSSLIPGRSLLSRCRREVWERVGERVLDESLLVTSQLKIKSWLIPYGSWLINAVWCKNMGEGRKEQGNEELNNFCAWKGGAQQTRFTVNKEILGWSFCLRSITFSDIDECRNKQSCPEDKVCENTEGAYNCACKTGFKDGENGTCIGWYQLRVKVMDIHIFRERLSERVHATIPKCIVSDF